MSDRKARGTGDREPRTMRIDSSLLTAARARAQAEGHGSVARVVEAALRLYLSAEAAADVRAALLGEVESGLLTRLDTRLGKAVHALRDIAAKANYDHSLALCLLEQVLAALFARDPGALREIVKKARHDAAERLRRAQIISDAADPAELEQARREAAGARQQLQQAEQQAQKLTVDLRQVQQQLVATSRELEQQQGTAREELAGWKTEVDHLRRLLNWEARRVPWARQQHVAQAEGFFRGKTLDDWLSEYDQKFPRPE